MGIGITGIWIGIYESGKAQGGKEIFKVSVLHSKPLQQHFILCLSLYICNALGTGYPMPDQGELTKINNCGENLQPPSDYQNRLLCRAQVG